MKTRFQDKICTNSLYTVPNSTFCICVHGRLTASMRLGINSTMVDERNRERCERSAAFEIQSEYYILRETRNHSSLVIASFVWSDREYRFHIPGVLISILRFEATDNSCRAAGCRRIIELYGPYRSSRREFELPSYVCTGPSDRARIPRHQSSSIRNPRRHFPEVPVRKEEMNRRRRAANE